MARKAKTREPGKSVPISELSQDPRNANKGTARGRAMLADSLAEYGAGRPPWVDRNGVIGGGNKTIEAAAALGHKRVRVVRTDGRTLVVVQRTDLDLEKDEKAMELAIADNRTGELGISWDPEILATLRAAGADLEKMGFSKLEQERMFGAGGGEPGALVVCPKCGKEFPG